MSNIQPNCLNTLQAYVSNHRSKRSWVQKQHGIFSAAPKTLWTWRPWTPPPHQNYQNSPQPRNRVINACSGTDFTGRVLFVTPRFFENFALLSPPQWYTTRYVRTARNHP